MAFIDEVQIGREARKALIIKIDKRKIDLGCWGGIPLAFSSVHGLYSHGPGSTGLPGRT